ncbi:MAG: MFS transporter [Proteobacteria bacterium]|nr:MFS transporter [Pseudomonadota bacterium]
MTQHNTTNSSFFNKVVSSSQQTVPAPIWAIGIVTFLVNISSVMVFGFSAIYLKSILGVGTGWIGFLEGVVEGMAYAMKVLSGLLSDYLRRRKNIMGFGYGLIAITRPILALSTSYGGVFIARLLDRLGNGIQSTPRDALVGDLSPSQHKGACYGLRQTLGTMGSFIGGFLGIIAMVLTGSNFHMVFWLATIPASLAFIILILFVKESEKNLHPQDHQKRHPLHLSDIPRLGKDYWLLMIVVAIFMLARLGEALLMLHGHQNFGLSQDYAPMVMILLNITYSLTSYPIGKLSDRMSRYTLLAGGCIVLIIADILLASSTQLWLLFVAVALWGVQMGISQAMFVSLIADTVPNDLRGTGFGFFYLISAFSLVIASTSAGTITQYFGEAMSFLGSAVFASLSLLALFIVKPKKKADQVKTL